MEGQVRIPIYRDIASLETIKAEDDLQTAQLNQLVESLESSLESYKSGALERHSGFYEVYEVFLEAKLRRQNSWQIII